MGEKSDSKKLAVFDLGDVSMLGGAFRPFQIKRLAQAGSPSRRNSCASAN